MNKELIQISCKQDINIEDATYNYKVESKKWCEEKEKVMNKKKCFYNKYQDVLRKYFEYSPFRLILLQSDSFTLEITPDETGAVKGKDFRMLDRIGNWKIVLRGGYSMCIEVDLDFSHL